MSIKIQSKDDVTIRFAGDSGDGMQLTGTQFTNTTALAGNDLSTLPDFPAEIRAPAGTVAGVSGFQIHFGSRPIHTPGDMCDVLVAMNAAALKANLHHLKSGGIIIANVDGFGKRDLSLAKYGPDENPLDQIQTSGYTLIQLDITKLTRASLKDSGLPPKEVDRCKNMFVLGIIYWLYSRDTKPTVRFIRSKFEKKPEIAEANVKVLQDGYTYGTATELFSERYTVDPARIEPGTYRNITGNEATVIGLAATVEKSGLPMFLGSYPITPASDILHGLSKLKEFGIRTFQAEDEISAVTSAIGAAFGGSLAVTSSSGPGIALKTEAIALATMLELPLVIINVQRAGPSTGMPTKTEQSDLLQAVYGRAGECPVAVLAPGSPADCFEMIFEAARLAVEHMIPVMFLSDGYIANGAEPWKFPKPEEIRTIKPNFVSPEDNTEEEPFLPYLRDERLVRKWATPGTAGFEHRIGGLEKQDGTGNISYDPDNHHKMTQIREEKRNRIADHIPPQMLEEGDAGGDLLVIGWGSTHGSVKSAVNTLIDEGHKVAHAHIRYLSPFPANLGELIRSFDSVLVPEINSGQLIKLLRDQFPDVAFTGYNRVRGVPLTVSELKEEILRNVVNTATHPTK